MIDFGNMFKLQELMAEYKKKWGRNVDYLGLPRYVSDELLIKVLKRAIETGETVQDAYNALKDRWL